MTVSPIIRKVLPFLLGGALAVACGGKTCDKSDCHNLLILRFGTNPLIPAGSYSLTIEADDEVWDCRFEVQENLDAELDCEGVEAFASESELANFYADPTSLHFVVSDSEGIVREGGGEVDYGGRARDCNKCRVGDYEWSGESK